MDKNKEEESLKRQASTSCQNLPLEAIETTALPCTGASPIVEIIVETVPIYTGSARTKGAIVINDISAPKLSVQLQLEILDIICCFYKCLNSEAFFPDSPKYQVLRCTSSSRLVHRDLAI